MMVQNKKNVYRFKKGTKGQCITYNIDGKISFPHKDGFQPSSGDLWKCEVVKEFEKFDILKLVEKVNEAWTMDPDDFFFYKAIINNIYDGKKELITVEHIVKKGDLKLALHQLYEGNSELAESIFNLLLTRLPNCVKEAARKEFTDYIDLYIQAELIRSNHNLKLQKGGKMINGN